MPRALMCGKEGSHTLLNEGVLVLLRERMEWIRLDMHSQVADACQCEELGLQDDKKGKVQS